MAVNAAYVGLVALILLVLAIPSSRVILASLPVIAQILIMLILSASWAAAFLLNVGGSARGIAPAIEALTYIDTASPDAVACLLDSIGYDLPGLRASIGLAIARQFRKINIDNVHEIMTPKRTSRLWWVIRSSFRNKNLTLQQADEFINAFDMVVRSSNKGMLRCLNTLPAIRDRRSYNDVHRHLRENINVLLGKILS